MYLRRLFLNDYFILGIIFINVVVIFIGGFSLDISSQKVIEALDNFFTVLFVIEAGVKIKELSASKYFNDSWNIFDFILVVIAIPSLVFFFLPNEFLPLNSLLVFRILRVFKFFRFIKFIPNINKVINGFYRAAKSSLLILFAFGVFNIVIAVLSTFLFKNIASEHFGNPLISLYNIFKVFTVEGWYEIPDSMIENNTFSPFVEFFIRIYFVTILFVGGIFGLSLVNSIFVDSMISDNNNPLEEKIENLNKKVDELTEIIKNKS